MRPIAAVDLDGTIAQLTHKRAPYPGAKEFLEELHETFDIVIHTCRCNPDIGGYAPHLLANSVRAYLEKYELPYDEIFVGTAKPLAHIYIDDRAVACCPDVDSEAYRKVLEKVKAPP